VTTEQKSIVIGTVLGDSCIWLAPNDRTTLEIKQCKEHKEYVFWFYNKLKYIFPREPKQRKDNGQWYINSSCSTELSNLRKIFYPNGKKIIPENIGELLKSPVSLAVWFMDDGTLDYRFKDHCAFHLCTNGFSLEESKRLADVLDKNFGISATVHYTLCRGKRHARIYIGAKGRGRFIKLVMPFIINCFKYKLPQFRHPSETQPHGLDGR